MDSKNIKKILLIAGLAIITQTPSFAAKKNSEELIEMPKTYPAKYTYNYVKQITPMYKDVGKDEVLYVALDMLKGTNGEFSRNAILGNNLSRRPVKIEFKDLGTINPDFTKTSIIRLLRKLMPGQWKPQFGTRL